METLFVITAVPEAPLLTEVEPPADLVALVVEDTLGVIDMSVKVFPVDGVVAQGLGDGREGEGRT